MFELSNFYEYCRENNVDVIPFANMPSAGITMQQGSDCAIFLDFAKIASIQHLRGICLHEQGHIATGAFHKVSSPFELVERSEYRANRWVAQQHLTEQDFRAAFSAGITELWELAEYFDIPEQDVKNALTYWSERKGINFNSQ